MIRERYEWRAERYPILTARASMPQHRSGWCWVTAAAVQVLRRSPVEALVWTTAAAVLAARGLSRWQTIGPAVPGDSTSAVHGGGTLLSTFAPVAVLALQIGLRGGFLWQLAPLVPLAVIPLVVPDALSPSGALAWWAAWGVGWLLAAASLAALLAFPPVPFPPRTVPRASSPADRTLFDVGFRHGEEDVNEGDNGGDGATEGTKGRRAFYAWYPAARGSKSSNSTGSTTSSAPGGSRGHGRTSHYFPQFASQMDAMFESMQYRLPTALLFSHLRYVHPDTVADAPVLATPPADDGEARRWPVIVFSHGLYGFPSLYSHLCSSLASLGYVVVAVGHTDGSGSIVSPARGDILTAFEPLPTSPSGQELGGHDLWKFRHRQLNVRVRDLETCLDTLRWWNSDSDSPFYEAMDLERVTVAGHSFGGGTSLGLVLRQAEARAERNRVRAAVLFDGWMFPLKGSEGPAFDRVIPAEQFDASVPVLFINAEMWQGSESYFMLNKERIRQLCELSRGRWRSFTLKGTGHHNWNDFPSYAPIVSRLVGLTRERDLTAVHDDTMALVDSFLTDVLAGRAGAGGTLPLLDRVVSTMLRESPQDVLDDVDLPPQQQ